MASDEYLLTSEAARELLARCPGAQTLVSLDLGLSETQVRMSDEGLVLPDGMIVSLIDIAELAKRKKRIFSIGPAGISALEIAHAHYYKLTATSGAPTLEIDGVQMHRTKDIDPFEDARQKVDGTVRRGDIVLDTCGGLGYTAAWSVRLGAGRVVSIEVCPEVRELCGRNPWSREIHDPRIILVDADVFEYVRGLGDASFDSIVHDPPRFSLAGELYGREFHEQLVRVLRPNGRLFHYTGTPHSRRGRRDVPSEVAKRLRDLGLQTRYEPMKLGISARKERGRADGSTQGSGGTAP